MPVFINDIADIKTGTSEVAMKFFDYSGEDYDTSGALTVLSDLTDFVQAIVYYYVLQSRQIR